LSLVIGILVICYWENVGGTAAVFIFLIPHP